MAKWVELREVLEHPEKYGNMEKKFINYHIDGGDVLLPTELTGCNTQNYSVSQSLDIYWQARLFDDEMYLVGSKVTPSVLFSTSSITNQKLEEIVKRMAKPYGNEYMGCTAMAPTVELAIAGISFDKTANPDYAEEKGQNKYELLKDGIGSSQFYPVVCLPENTFVYMEDMFYDGTTAARKIFIKSIVKSPAQQALDELDVLCGKANMLLHAKGTPSEFKDYYSLYLTYKEFVEQVTDVLQRLKNI